MFTSKNNSLVATFLFIFIFHLAALSSFAQEPRPVVRISVPGIGSVYTMPFRVAQEQNWYAEEGLDVRILEGVKTAPSIQMLVGGTVEVSQTVGTTTLGAIVHGAPLKVVMVFHDKPSYWLYAKKSVRSFADLKSAKLGSFTPGSTGDRLLKIVLEKNGLDWRKDLTIVYIGASDVLTRALLSGSLDAAVLSPPGNLIAGDSGFTDLASFRNEVGALTGGVATTDPFLIKRRDLLVPFLRATSKGLKSFKNIREGSARIMAKYMSIPYETALRSYDANIPLFISSGLISEEFQDKVLDFQLKAIGTDKKVLREKVFDFSIVNSLGPK